MKPAHIISLAIIVVCLLGSLIAFSDSVAQHTTIAMAKRSPGKTLQVPGNIVKDSVRYDGNKGQLSFTIVDAKDATSAVKVVYSEPKPENFDTANKVEAVGEYKNGVFVAKNLLVKCPSKYNDAPAPDGAVASK